MATDSVATDAQILTTIIAPDRADFAPHVAQTILQMEFSDEQLQRNAPDLADRHNQGSLTESELAELQSYRRVGNFLSIIQAKARLSLKRPAVQD